MNKADVIRTLEDVVGSRQRANDALEAFLDLVIREVAAGGRVSITGFGTFERAERASRTGRNPRTGEAVRIEPTAVPRFKPGTLFKTVVEDPSLLPVTELAVGRAPATKRATA